MSRRRVKEEPKIMRSNRLTKSFFGSAIVVALAFGVFASSALASQATAEANWTIEGPTFANGQTVGCETEGSFRFETTVGTTPIAITATKVECVEATLSNSGTTALDGGKLKFSGLTVDGLAAGCTAVEPISTNLLSTKLVTTTDTADVPSGLGDTFAPAETGGAWFTLKLNSNCAGAAGSYPLKGSVVGESNKLGTLAVKQPLKFSSTINKGFTEDALTFGGKLANFTGTMLNSLTGTNAGKKFGAIK
jgi:hypothetical protein